jgi:hypothetical protein
VIRRTATVLVSAPKTFVAISLLGAIPGVVGLLIPQSSATSGVDIGLLIVLVALGLLGGIWSIVVAIMTVVGTAQVAAGRRPRLLELFSDLDRPVISSIAGTLILLLIAAAGVAAAFIAIVALAAVRLAVLSVFLMPVGMAIGVIAFLRTSLLLPAIVLETSGARAAIRRSWDVTHRLTWHLLGYYLGVGLLVGLPVIAIQLSTLFVPSLLGRLAIAVVTAPIGVLGAIGSTVLFGQLIGRPWNLSDRVPRAVAIAVSVAILSLVGIFAVGSMAVAQSPFFTYMNDRTAGQVQFGRSPGPANGCHVGAPAASFGPDDPVYASAVFMLPVGNGTLVTRELTRNGAVVTRGPIAFSGFTSCYVEQIPVETLGPGNYRLTFREQQYVLADGQFVIQGGTSTQTSRAAGFRGA